MSKGGRGAIARRAIDRRTAAREARNDLLALHAEEAMRDLARDHVAVIATGPFAAALGASEGTVVQRMRRQDADRILTPAMPPTFATRLRSALAFPVEGSATIVLLDATSGPVVVHVRPK
ncbi:MAG: hypothetical protein K1X94_28525 [Sandaracinaceae bacterium]|nr:hypothetical protein [Sandaracinaceae bacterium]